MATNEVTIEVPIDRARIKFADAAEMMGIDIQTLTRLQSEYNIFTISKDGESNQSHRYLMYDEVRLYCEESARSDAEVARAAVKTHRRKLKRR